MSRTTPRIHLRRTCFALTAGAFAVCTACANPTAEPAPTSPPQNGIMGTLTFVRPIPSKYNQTALWIRAAAGGQEVVLPTADTSAETPAWSPDGRQVAFTGRDGLERTNIFVLDVATGTVDRLTDRPYENGSPTWSPDGERIAFSSTSEGFPQIWVMNSDGSEQHMITDPSAINDDPDWSPDGRRIAFVSGKSGNNEIYTMDPDGRRLQRLTHNDIGQPDQYPDWSPDGKKIAWTHAENDNADLWVMNADGSEPRRLTTDGALDSGAAWSPDGAYLAFTSTAADGLTQIWIMRPDGTQLHQLTASDVPAYQPAWVPPGVRVPDDPGDTEGPALAGPST